MEAFNFFTADLEIVYEKGTNAKGEMLYTSATYQGIREQATVQQLQATAQVIASLQNYVLADVYKVETLAV